MMLRKSFFVIVILVLLLAGCQPVSVDEAKAQFCNDLAEYKAALGAVQALTPESTVEEAEAALETAQDEWYDVLNSAYLVRDANWENLDQAYEDLDDAIRQLEDVDTIQDAAAAVQAEVENVNAAYDEFYNLQCSDVVTATQ
jgi:hypothetical protein